MLDVAETLRERLAQIRHGHVVLQIDELLLLLALARRRLPVGLERRRRIGTLNLPGRPAPARLAGLAAIRAQGAGGACAFGACCYAGTAAVRDRGRQIQRAGRGAAAEAPLRLTPATKAAISGR